jgi:antitoxin ParD1/3/4
VAGHYAKNSEYLRDLIRPQQERNAEIEAIRSAFIEDEASGEPKRFDGASFKITPRGSQC